MSAKTKFKKFDQVRPDTKGRVSLGKRTMGVSSYILKEDQEGRILLEPLVEIPAREKWLFENRKALGSVKKGLDQSEKNETQSLGSFAKFVQETDK